MTPPEPVGPDATDAAAPAGHERRWPATLALAVAMGLYLVLPDPLIIGPRWVLPLLEALLAIPLLISNPDRRERDSGVLRTISILLIALVSLANLVALALLVHNLFTGDVVDGNKLVRSAIALWGTSVIVFGLWYWELDSGGPAVRHLRHAAHRDFLFPQQASPDVFPRGWTPSFVDYLYTSFTNSTAFSPTDTMPLTTWAKLLMMLQAAAALVTIALVAARAVNILS